MEIASANSKLVDKNFLSRSIIGFDNDCLIFYLLNWLIYQSKLKNITLICSEGKYIFLVAKTCFKNMTYDKIFCHTFYCHRISKSLRKWRFCTRFYADDGDLVIYFEKRFKFSIDKFKRTDLERITSQLKATNFSLSLYYIASDFVQPCDTRNENHSSIFF